MTGIYAPLQVALSVLIAVSASSYAALDLAGRVTAASGRTRLAWLIGGSTAMGIGIWATHYIGMMAFHFPQEPESRPPAAYDKRLSRYSLVFK
jgi:NO-binding membrane sensor protein with MHYT domain